jgi:hypothetical protein
MSGRLLFGLAVLAGEGAWGAYVLREAIPAALKRTGADPQRVAIGISMGGFGALDLARISPGRFLRGRRPLAGSLAHRRRDALRRV